MKKQFLPVSIACLVSLAGFSGALAEPEGGGLKIYADQIDVPVYSRITFGFDRDGTCSSNGAACSSDVDCSGVNNACGVTVDALVPGTQSSIWTLVCNPLTPPSGTDCQANTWDFSINNLTNFPGMAEFSSTTTPINPAETCSWDKCGFTEPFATLGREDRIKGASVISTLQSQVREDRLNDTTLWLRASVRNEGVPASAGLGKGESRLCYVTGNRTEVPLFQFKHCDLEGCYMQLGDSWEPEHPVTGVPQAFQCENDIFNHTCPNSCGLFCPLYTYACSGYGGKQSSQVVNEGAVTLPSGHTFQALVLRQNAEFCVALSGGCAFNFDEVRTVLYLWEVPYLGTVVRLMSTTTANSVTDWNTGDDRLAEMDIKFGLFPPLSVSVGMVADTEVDLSWNPGLDTHRIAAYRVYWDTDSGFSGSYAFNSITHPGQVAFAGTAATISGLTPGTHYYFTVSAISNFQDPKSGIVTTYETHLPPVQIPAIPVTIPIEVEATTTGGAGPAGAVPNGADRPGTPLRLNRGAGSLLDLTWSASCDAGDDDYGVYEGILGNFTSHVPLVCTSSKTTSKTVSPGAGNRYYVVVPSNGTAEGSYGEDSAGAERVVSASACAAQLVGSPICP